MRPNFVKIRTFIVIKKYITIIISVSRTGGRVMWQTVTLTSFVRNKRQQSLTLQQIHATTED